MIFTVNRTSPFKRMKHGIILLWIGLWSFGTTQAQSAFDLNSCVEYALSHHGSTQIYTNQAAIAQQQAREALSGYLPQVNGNASLDDNLKRQTTIIPAGVFSQEDLKVQFGNQYATTTTVQLDQVIFDQSLLTGIRASQPNAELARLKTEQNQQDLMIQTAKAYYQVLATRQKMALLTENEQKFSEQLTLVQLQVDKGVANQTDLDRVRVSLNNVRSQKQVLRTNEQLAMNRLKFAMGMPQDTQLEIAEVSLLELDLELPESEGFDPNQNLDLLIQDQNIALQEIDLKRREASRLPSVSGYARYGAQALGNELGASYSNWFDFASVGLKVNVPIFSGLRRESQISQSRLNLDNARINYELTQNSLDLQLQNAWTALESARINAESNRENLTLAKSVFDNSSLQYEKGIVPFSSLLNADYAYKEAQNNYINSVIDYLTARLDYERAGGSLPEYLSQL